MTNYNEIFCSKEYYMFNKEKRVAITSVFIAPGDEFLCISREVSIDDKRECAKMVEIFKTYKEVRIWLENVQWYANGNQYDNTEYKD